MIIHQIQKLLDQMQFDTTIVPASVEKGNALDELIVSIKKDYLQRERILEIKFNPLDPNKAPPDQPYSIVFFVKLPISVQNLSTTQLASLILFINHVSEWPGFEFDELENQVFFRYHWLVKELGVDGFLLQNIIGSILLSLDAFSETIEQVATGRLTFDEVLQKIVELGRGSTNS